MKRGRSPRVRGSLVAEARERFVRGSIPACAGEPSEIFPSCYMIWVDPRVCGGANMIALPKMPLPGRSPRVRGSRDVQNVNAQVQRSIPACAGEPRTGGRIMPIVGSIPACAGEPRTSARRHPWSWVDPRVYGGAPNCEGWCRAGGGRSPRVRGSLTQGRSRKISMRSIPACAGEPFGRML